MIFSLVTPVYTYNRIKNGINDMSLSSLTSSLWKVPVEDLDLKWGNEGFCLKTVILSNMAQTSSEPLILVQRKTQQNKQNKTNNKQTNKTKQTNKQTTNK